MEKITLYYFISNEGDGSGFITWFINKDTAQKEFHSKDEDSGDLKGDYSEQIGTVETFVGSDIYNEALENERNTV